MEKILSSKDVSVTNVCLCSKMDWRVSCEVAEWLGK